MATSPRLPPQWSPNQNCIRVMIAPSAYQKGNYFYEKGDYEEALKWFEIALSSDDGDFNSSVGKADSLYMLGRYEDASVSYENALKRSRGF